MADLVTHWESTHFQRVYITESHIIAAPEMLCKNLTLIVQIRYHRLCVICQQVLTLLVGQKTCAICAD